MKKLLLNLITIYQSYLSFDRGLLAFFAPGGACKYEITCSQYAKQAIVENGTVKGIWVATKRIWSCR